MRLNPIVGSELVRFARKPWTYRLRTLVALLFLFLVASRYGQIQADVSRAIQPRSVSGPIADVFLSLMWWQGLALILLVTGSVAGSVAVEDRRGTMLELLASRLTSGEIVLGKFVSRMIVALAIPVATLPVFIVVALLARIDAWVIAICYGVTFSCAVFVGSLSLLVSVASRRPRAAVVSAYLLVGAWLVLPPALEPITGNLSPPIGPFVHTLERFAMHTHPSSPERTLQTLLGYSGWSRFAGAAMVPFFRKEARQAVIVLISIQSLASLLMLTLSVALLRPRRLGLRRRWFHRGARLRRAAVELAASRRPPVGDQPILWKERHLPESIPWPSRRAVAIPLAVLAFCLLVDHPAREDAMSYWGFAPVAEGSYAARTDLNKNVRGLGSAAAVLAILVAAISGASSITSERERGTWTSIETSPLHGLEIVRGKLVGAILGASGALWPLAVVLLTGVALGALHPVAAVACAVACVAYMACVAAVGVYFSMRSRGLMPALLATLAIAMAPTALAALIFLPMAPSARMPVGVWWELAASPFQLIRACLGTPEEVRSLVDPAVGVPSNSPFLAIRWGLPRLLVVSLAMHAAVAAVALRAAARAYDRPRANTPAVRPGSPPPRVLPRPSA